MWYIASFQSYTQEKVGLIHLSLPLYRFFMVTQKSFVGQVKSLPQYASLSSLESEFGNSDLQADIDPNETLLKIINKFFTDAMNKVRYNQCRYIYIYVYEYIHT